MGKTTQESIDEVMNRWDSGLRLSADQKAKLLTIVTQRENELQQMRENNKGSDKKAIKLANIKEIRKKYGPDMLALLNDQQRKDWKKLAKTRRAAKTR
jgi:hypothetical protein